MVAKGNQKPHIYLGRTGKTEPFTSTSTGGSNGGTVPARNRAEHGKSLFSQLRDIERDQAVLEQAAQDLELESTVGIQVEFQSIPGVELAVESLADARQNIELLNVIHRDDKISATIFAPVGKLQAIERKIQDYIDEKKNKNGAAIDNRSLIDAIESFRTAALVALWSDEIQQFPIDSNEVIWWEVWLAVRGNRQAVLNDFKLLAIASEMEVSQKILEFPERTVLLAKGSKEQFSQSSLLLNNVAELRRAKETAAFFDELPPEEQPEWSTDLLDRLVPHNPSQETPYVCILDTGVNSSHPLLAQFNNSCDQFSRNAGWTVSDDHGHGTGMAGLAVWGDLTDPLASSEITEINHRLESVKVLRYANDNEGEHLGIVTSEGVSLPEIQNPDRTRVYCMALSVDDTRDRGRPSAWSAAIDSLAVDYLGENLTPRLFTICTGNAGESLNDMIAYPGYSLLQDIADPGQSWNALTIGAYTEKTTIVEPDHVDYIPVAPTGGISPYSRTSATWTHTSPLKPEIVFEGGNAASDGHVGVSTASLSLLTTFHRPVERLFSTSNATSAATALAARFAARIYVEYPLLWPETVRALMVHSAEWTAAMVSQFAQGNTARQQAQHRVRCVGYGVPNLQNALWSAGNSLALIVEDRLQPYEKRSGKIATRDMHLHELPWPMESLLSLGSVNVRMTVTLSYFIEPNPSSRVVSGKYNYQSHGLRFDVKRPTESQDDFRKRINRQSRDEEETTTTAPADPNWLLGSQFRHKGSIHKDVWTGTAADLAERGQIAVYPTMGWWRTRTALERFDKKARYSLIVSIAVPEVDVDIYSEITAQIPIEQTIEI